MTIYHPTRGRFARRFLRGIGAPVTRDNMLAMMSWMQAEGDAGRFNPLNTTLTEPGSTTFNWVGVQNYRNWKDGVRATVKTLSYGANRDLYGYGRIRGALRNGHNPRGVLEAVEESAWGTGGLALRVYEGTANSTLLGYKHHRLMR